MDEFLFLIIPNVILFLVYGLTFSKNNCLNKNYYLIVVSWLIVFIYFLLDGYFSREKGQEVSHFGNVVIATSGIIFSLPVLLYLRYKNIEPLWIIWILMILPAISFFIIFLFLALTNNIWGM
ncbi:MAG: hypothetical protein PHH98_05105 [Candidatus Gracilibacteria bacterium]|nr:hypothetical protein [Candidatus Gracilibacteria bacterium]